MTCLVISDSGMRRFANDIRWKEFWMLKKAEEEQTSLFISIIITFPISNNQ
jgi:hypothetical protein